MILEKFGWKPDSRFAVDAQAVGERLTKLGKGDFEAVTPKEIVDDARPKGSVLHPLFEWGDRKAAELYREEQARKVARSLRIVEAASPDVPASERIAFVHVVSDKVGGGAYVRTDKAMSDAELRKQILADALAELKAWRWRYGHLGELAALVSAVDNFTLPEPKPKTEEKRPPKAPKAGRKGPDPTAP